MLTDHALLNRVEQINSRCALVLLFLACTTLVFFNDFPWLERLLTRESAMLKIPSLFFTVLLLIPLLPYLRPASWFRKSLRIPIALLFLFVFWVIVAGGLRIAFSHDPLGPLGTALYLKAAATQIILLSAALGIFSYAKAKRIDLIGKFSTFALWSALAIAPYVALEVWAYKWSSGLGLQVLTSVESFFHYRIGDLYNVRQARAYTVEPSYLNLVLAWCLPLIMIRYWEEPNPKGHRRSAAYAFALFVLLVSFYASNSRIAYLAIHFIILLSLTLVLWKRQKIAHFGRKLGLFLGALGSAFVLGNGDGRALTLYQSMNPAAKDASIYTRFAFMAGAVNVGINHPLTGVGLGLSGAYIHRYLPSYASDLQETSYWVQMGQQKFQAPAFSMLPKYFAEVGVGLIWLLLAVSIMLYRILPTRTSPIQDDLVFVLIAGLFISSFAVQGFLFPGYWLGLSALFFVLDRRTSFRTQREPSNSAVDTPRCLLWGDHQKPSADRR